jgi:hypoxanthine phosphoribosyltransferase
MSRGGLIPSVHLSHKFNIPMKIADISHPLSNGDNASSHKNTVPDITYWNSKVLIIDDILDSGYSIDECLNKLNVETCFLSFFSYISYAYFCKLESFSPSFGLDP